MLPYICTYYQKMVELITSKNDKAYCLHLNTICGISHHARCKNWTNHQPIGVIAQDSANVNTGTEHDYVTNTLKLKGGDESYHSIAALSWMFQWLAQIHNAMRTIGRSGRILFW
jgi:hypothetical protein